MDNADAFSSVSHGEFPVVIVTGLSGSGKSTALNVFEDLGFFTVDGLPAVLAPQMADMLSSAGLSQYLGAVFGMDLRQSQFVKDYEQALDELRVRGYSPKVLFLEAKPDALMTRYATTRRPHPLQKEGLGLEQALAIERERLKHIRKNADVVIDTSTHSVHDLRRVIQRKWNALKQIKRPLRVHIITFGFKYGTPAEADMVFDLRFLPNPYFVPELRSLSGLDAPVAEFVLNREPGATFLVRLTDFLEYVLAQCEAEGRFRMAIAIGCTGGRHRSVAVAEALTGTLDKANYTVSLEHRHLELG